MPRKKFSVSLYPFRQSVVGAGFIDGILRKYIKISFIPSALVYAFGYLINANYYRSIGLSSIPFAKAQYIETGITFVVFSVAAVSFIFSFILTGNVLADPSNNKNESWLKFKFWLFRLSAVISLYGFSLVLVFESLFAQHGSQWNVFGYL